MLPREKTKKWKKFFNNKCMQRKKHTHPSKHKQSQRRHVRGTRGRSAELQLGHRAGRAIRECSRAGNGRVHWGRELDHSPGGDDHNPAGAIRARYGPALGSELDPVLTQL